MLGGKDFEAFLREKGKEPRKRRGDNQSLHAHMKNKSASIDMAERTFFDGDLDSAYHQFEPLAEEEDGDALYYMYLYHMHQLGSVEKNCEKAREYLKMAAEAGNAVCEIVSDLNDSSVKRLVDLASEGQGQAVIEAGILCLERKYANIESDEIIGILEELREPTWISKLILGRLYAAHHDEEWVEKAISIMQGINFIPRAKYYLAQFMIERKSKEPEPDDLISILSDAAECGDSKSAYLLAKLYDEGSIIDTDNELARSWYEKAAEMGDEDALLMLGENFMNMSSETEASRIDDYIKRSANNGNLRALELAADRAAHSFHPEITPYEWYIKSEQFMEQPGIEKKIGYCFYDGDGVEQSLVSALSWYKKAYDNGDIDCALEIGIVYLDKDNPDMAVKWFVTATENGNLEATNRLAYSYLQGRGVKKDTERAVSLWEQAAEKGYPAAMYNLALAYRQGEGTEKDIDKFREWLTHAVENDYPEAIGLYFRTYVIDTGRKVLEPNSIEMVAERCRIFYSNLFFKNYGLTGKYKNRAKDYEGFSVYLFYNDSKIRHGKREFLITDRGLFYNEKRNHSHIPFWELAVALEIKVVDKNVIIDNKRITCLSAPTEEELEDLRQLYLDIQCIVRKGFCMKYIGENS